MEPFELTVQQVTFEEGEPQTDLDSFDTVVNYDTHFGSSQESTFPGTTTLSYTFTDAYRHRGISRSHAASPDLQKSFFPSSVSNPSRQKLTVDNSQKTNKHSAISTNAVHQSSRPSTQAQPSWVKTTQIHSKLVCSDGVSAGLLHQHNIIHPDYCLREIDSSFITRKEKISDSDIRTLFKISSNTSAVSKAKTFSRFKMSHQTSPSPCDGTFETVADALHLQNSVIGDRKIAPAPPDVVAQIIAETERRLKGLSPAVTPTPSTQVSVPSPSGSSASKDGTQSAEFPNDLIRIPAKDITMTTDKGSWLNPSLPKEENSGRIKHPGDHISDQGSVSEDNQSVSSAASELEAIQTDADRFIKSLPPYKMVNINDIVAQATTQQASVASETSFRPVKPVIQNSNTNQSYFNTSQLTDSGIGTETLQETSHIAMVTSTPKRVTDMDIPQVGPLFNKILNEPTPGRIHHDSPSQGVKSTELDAVLREKAKLEGQLEMLTEEAQTTLQERAELQAQVSALKIKMKSLEEKSKHNEVDAMKMELEKARTSRSILEQSLASAQKFLDEKVMETKGLHEELTISQESNDKMHSNIKVLRDDIRAKEVTIQALKNKIAELYVEVQSVLQSKMETESEMRSAKSDLNSLLNTKAWYQQQLQAAHEARSKLQHELTMLQGQAASQGSIIERLKTDNAKLRQQMKESQQKALKDKEMLAKHLEAIELDMMEREAAFQDIQRERTLLENTFDAKMQSVDDEKLRVQNLIASNNDLDSRLEKAQSDLKKKQNQIFNLENEQIEMMKKLTLSQESLVERDTTLDELQQKLIEVESQLASFQKSLMAKDSVILQLKEEKAATEIQLKAALEEKSTVDKALQNLRNDMGKVEKSFRSMKNELSTKAAEINQVQKEKMALIDQMEASSKCIEVEKQKAEVSLTENKTLMMEDLALQKSKYEEKIQELEYNVKRLEELKDDNSKDNESLKKELSQTEVKLKDTESQLETLKQEIDSIKGAGDGVATKEVIHENEQLKITIDKIEKQAEQEAAEHKEINKTLESDLTTLKTELTNRQAAFEADVDLLSSKLREVTAEKEKMETELDMAKKKYDLSVLEHQGQVNVELQKLAKDLETVKLEKQTLENQLLELQRMKEKDVELYTQQLSALDQQLQQERREHAEALSSQETSQKLELELEKEKGRVAGLMQTNSSLKQHVSQLEEALARRESSLVDIQTHTEGLVRQWQEGEDDYNRRIQQLEGVLQQEKEGQRELRKQIGLKITENKKLRRKLDTSKKEKETLQQDLDLTSQEKTQLQSTVDQWKQSQLGEQSKVNELEAENKLLHRELERVNRELADNMAREPVLQEQIQSLQWQLSQKCKEIETIQEHISLAEQRQNAEIDDLKKNLQDSQSETEALRAELAAAKQEKNTYQAKVSELRATLKASVQHHKLTKRMNSGGSRNNSEETKDVATQVKYNDVLIPPLPFDLEVVEKLIQDTGVKALESKPLDNLQTCLSSLRSQISGLQKQMDAHTLSIETSTDSWSVVERQVQDLRKVVKTITDTANNTMTTTSISGAAVDTDHMTNGVFHV